MICYESVVKNVVDVALFFFFFTKPLFLVMVGSSMIFFNFILAYKELTSQQL